MIVVVGIIALVLLAAVMLFSASRRRASENAIGSLSAETRRRDAARVSAGGVDADEAPSGREVERAAVLARREGDLVPAEPVELEAWVPPDPEAIGVARRQFLNRAIIGLFGLNLTGFGLAVVAQLYPGQSEGFGSAIRVGPLADVRSEIQASNGFLYKPEGRMWVVEYPAGALEKARAIYPPSALGGIEAGFKALFQKCPHLGCRVPECVSSQFFECPCHGSFYNQVGEKRGGPAPRGMDYFATSVEGGVLVVDTGTIIDGPPIGTNTTGQEREGPSCLGASSH